MPVGDSQVVRFFTDCGYEVVRLKGLKCESPVLIAHVQADTLEAAIREVDGDDVDAVVQVGTNLAMARVAAEAEERSGKPVVAITRPSTGTRCARTACRTRSRASAACCRGSSVASRKFLA